MKPLCLNVITFVTCLLYAVSVLYASVPVRHEVIAFDDTGLGEFAGVLCGVGGSLASMFDRKWYDSCPKGKPKSGKTKKKKE